jgi:hypothetical protein
MRKALIGSHQTKKYHNQPKIHVQMNLKLKNLSGEVIAGSFALGV